MPDLASGAERPTGLFAQTKHVIGHGGNQRPLPVRGRGHEPPHHQPGREEAAIYVGVTLATFDQMVNDGRLPKPSEFDGEFVWDLVQLDRAFDRLSGLRRTTL